MENNENQTKSNENKFDLLYTFLTYCLLLYPFSMGQIIALATNGDDIRLHFPSSYHGQVSVPFSLWGFAVACMPLGGLIGSVSVIYVAKAMGRRSCCAFLTLIGVIGDALWLISYFTKSFIPFVLSRIFLGASAGSTMNVGLCYYFELVHPSHKSVASGLVQVVINFGIIFTASLSVKEVIGISWYIVSIPLLVGHFLCFIVLFSLPESPSLIYERTKDEVKAKKALLKLRGKKYSDLDKEMAGIKSQIDLQAAVKSLSLTEFLFHKESAGATFVMLFMSAAQQLSGINAIIFYIATICSNTGIRRPDLAAVGMLGLCLLGSIVMTPLFSRIRTKILMLLGYCGMAISLFVAYFMGLYKLYPIFQIVLFSIFLVAFQVGPGPKGWVIVIEVYLLQYLLAAQTLITSINWTANFLVAILFQYADNLIGVHAILIFALFNIIFFTFIFFFLVDAKGKDNQSILREYNKKLPCFRSHNT